MGGDLIHKILDYASSKSKFADARFMDVSTNRISYRNGEFQGHNFSSEQGYAIRVVNRSISMGFTNSSDWSIIRDIIDRTIDKSNIRGKNLLFEGDAIKDSWKVNAKEQPEDVSVEEKAGIVRENDSAMESFGASVRINLMMDKRIRQTYLNSVGSEIHGDITRVHYLYTVGVTEGGEFEQSTEQYGSSGGYEYIEKLNLQDRIEEDVNQLRQSAVAARINPGKFDIIVGPDISGIVAQESCGQPAEFDRIAGREAALEGESILTGKKLPSKIGSAAICVIDDPTRAGSFGYYKYDDEGVRAKMRYLYRNGEIDEFILNRESAAQLGSESNAGGRSTSWNLEPLAKMSTTYIEPGDHKFDDLFDGVKRGVYIKSFAKGNNDGMGFNGKYVGKEAYFITNGDISGRVRRPVIETDTIKFYSSIDAIGNDLEFSAGMCCNGDPEQGVDVWMGGPHMRLRDVYLQ